MNRNPSVRPSVFTLIQSAISTATLPSLGPEKRLGVRSPELLQSEIDLALRRAGVSETTAELVRAAALLWHDHLGEAHAIVQSGHSSEASFIHGIIHRREPDYANAKYWFHRVGRHALFPELARRVEKFLQSSGETSRHLTEGGHWQPVNFIDVCEEALAHRDRHELMLRLQQVQKIEFDTLLEHICGIDAGT